MARAAWLGTRRLFSRMATPSSSARRFSDRGSLFQKILIQMITLIHSFAPYPNGSQLRNQKERKNYEKQTNKNFTQLPKTARESLCYSCSTTNLNQKMKIKNSIVCC